MIDSGSEQDQLDTPVAVILFNRPDTTQRVFEAIRAVRPTRLLLVADGPRPHRPSDPQYCAASRAVFDQVDWPCDVRRDFATTNMGARGRVASGLNWVFSEVESAIVLEDDCLPDATFFRFAQELLRRYASDERVMGIGGTNVLGTWKDDRQSYHFSELGSIWGWATWRRAWSHFDVELTAWSRPEERAALVSALRRIGPCEARERQFQRVFEHEVDAWDYQWEAARFLQSGLFILPSRNLITNLGCGHPEATNTTFEGSPYANLPLQAASFPLVHPRSVVTDHQFDRMILAKQEGPKRIWRHLPDPVKARLRPIWRRMRSITARLGGDE